MTVPAVDIGGWGPSQQEFYDAWEAMGVGKFLETPDPATGDVGWIFNPPYAGNMTYTHSWGGVMLTGNKHPNGPSTDPDNPTYVEGWHMNIRMYGQPLLEPLTSGLEQYDEVDDGQGGTVQVLKSVWDRTHLASSSWWNLTSFPQGIPGLGFPPGYGKDPGSGNVSFADIRNFSSQSNRWQ